LTQSGFKAQEKRSEVDGVVSRAVSFESFDFVPMYFKKPLLCACGVAFGLAYERESFFQKWWQ
jgi:hypothetical protein